MQDPQNVVGENDDLQFYKLFCLFLKCSPKMWPVSSHGHHQKVQIWSGPSFGQGMDSTEMGEIISFPKIWLVNQLGPPQSRCAQARIEHHGWGPADPLWRDWPMAKSSPNAVGGEAKAFLEQSCGVKSYFVGCVFLFLCPIFLGCCQFPVFDFYALFSFCHRFLVFILLWEEKLLSF